jgi:FkbM family methyltransferase
MKALLKRLMKIAGVDLTNPDLKRRTKIVKHYNIDLLFDIGANQGQYAKKMRQLGFHHRIVSFEPLKNAFNELQKASEHDKRWKVNNYAIGNEDTKSLINIAANSYSSSILKMLPSLIQNAPEARYVAQQEIEIKKLDSVFPSFSDGKDHVMIKIDTQGFEKNVIDGAIESLKKTAIVQLEMSLAPLYENEMLYMEMINYMDKRGFQLFSLETDGFSNPVTGQLLQADGIFVRKSLLQ